MIDSEKDNILIERFFDLDLSDKELAAFEERLSRDSEFEEKVKTYLSSQNVVDNYFSSQEEQLRKQQWKAILNKDEEKAQNLKIKTIVKTPWKWIGGIASGFILLFSFLQLNSNFQKPNIDQLITDAWNKKIGLNFKVTRSTNPDSLKQQINLAYDTYKTKNYQGVINILGNYATLMPYYEDVLLLKGLSNYKMGHVDIALKTLDSLAKYPTQKKSNEAKWYQGLIYLEIGNNAKAQEFIIILDNDPQEIILKE